MIEKTIIISILVSLIYSEFTNLKTCGLITAGYIVLNLNNFDRLLYSIILIILTIIIVKSISNYLIVYGKRQFAITVIIYYFLSVLFYRLLYVVVDITPIGYIVPALIANDIQKQGIFNSLVSLIIVTVMTYLVVAL